MSAAHSPAPWREVRGGENIADKNGIFVANVLQGISSLHTPTDRANARLIAAAPDLLVALQELHALVVGECPSLLNEDSGGNARLDLEVRAAIAKAEAMS